MPIKNNRLNISTSRKTSIKLEGIFLLKDENNKNI
jgi:hypothetical protein